MNDFIPQASAAFFGALAAFFLNYLHEIKKNSTIEKSSLIEAEYYLKAQRELFVSVREQLGDICQKTEKKWLKVTTKNDFFYLDEIYEGSSWLYCSGSEFSSFKLGELELNKFVFLLTKDSGSKNILDRLAISIFSYSDIRLFIKNRNQAHAKVMTLVDQLASESIDKDEAIRKIQANMTFHDLFCDGKNFTEQLVKKLDANIVEFQHSIEMINVYVNSKYCTRHKLNIC